MPGGRESPPGALGGGEVRGVVPARKDCLATRLASLGEPAISGARSLRNATSIDIEMVYRVAVI